MPYSDLASLPAYVKKRSKGDQEKWMAVWNSVFRKTGSESSAFKAANGSIKAAARWSDLKGAFRDSGRYELVTCFVSDVFPAFEAGGLYKVQVMRTGLWKDHPEYGDMLIGKSDLVDAIKNFRGSSRKLFLDFEHGITNPEMSTRPGENFGWMKDMWVEDLDGKKLEPGDILKSGEAVLCLFAEYELNEEANGWVKAGNGVLFSPAFCPEYQNKETAELQGMTIMGGAMTNTPYFDGMSAFVPVAASERMGKSFKRLAEMFPDSCVSAVKPEAMPVGDAVRSLEAMGFKIQWIDYNTFTLELGDAADLAAKMAELEAAGFYVTYFSQGPEPYDSNDVETMKEKDAGGEKAKKKGVKKAKEAKVDIVKPHAWKGTTGALYIETEA